MSIKEDLQAIGIELTDEQESGLKSYIGKHYVTRSDFNVKNNRVKELETEVSTLNARDFSTVERDRDDWKKKYETLKKENTDNMKKSKFFKALGDDCKDKEYMLYKYGGVDKLELDDKNEIKDLDNVVKSLKDSNASYFGKTPYVVQSTAGSANTEPLSSTSKANDALRTLLGK